MTNCPQCGGDVWDNRPKKRAGEMKPNGPDFACKDKEHCGWVQWPPKDKPPIRKMVGGPGMPTESPARQAKWTWAQLSQVYQQSMIVARKSVVGMGAALKVEWTMADLLSATATIFICATRDGVQQPPVREPELEEAEAGQG